MPRDCAHSTRTCWKLTGSSTTNPRGKGRVLTDHRTRGGLQDGPQDIHAQICTHFHCQGNDIAKRSDYGKKDRKTRESESKEWESIDRVS